MWREKWDKGTLLVHRYSVMIGWNDERNGYVAVCPDFPSVCGEGNTSIAALEDLEARIKAATGKSMANGWPLSACGETASPGELARPPQESAD